MMFFSLSACGEDAPESGRKSNDIANATESPAARAGATSKPGITEIKAPEGFVLIKGGTFKMGPHKAKGPTDQFPPPVHLDFILFALVAQPEPTIRFLGEENARYPK